MIKLPMTCIEVRRWFSPGIINGPYCRIAEKVTMNSKSKLQSVPYYLCSTGSRYTVESGKIAHVVHLSFLRLRLRQKLGALLARAVVYTDSYAKVTEATKRDKIARQLNKLLPFSRVHSDKCQENGDAECMARKQGQ